MPMDSLALCALLVALSALRWGEVGAAPPGNGLQDRPGRAQDDPEVLLSLRKRDAVTRGYNHIEFFDADYDDEYEEPTSQSVVPGPMVRCGYDPCAHLQVPCLELQRATSCLCPGVSGEEVVPEPPRLWEVTGVSDTSASVNWCAPPSAVGSYRLVYGPLGTAGVNTSTQPLSDRSRLFTLEGLSPGTGYLVCAVASNRAGDSRLGEGEWEVERDAPPGYGPCAIFTTTSARAHTLYITLAVLLLLLALALALILLRYLTLRRRRAATPEPSIGLQNPTYEEDKGGKPQA
ncbi:LRRN4 C-terminal-like protein [Mustelus asterias]